MFDGKGNIAPLPYCNYLYQHGKGVQTPKIKDFLYLFNIAILSLE